MALSIFDSKGRNASTFVRWDESLHAGDSDIAKAMATKKLPRIACDVSPDGYRPSPAGLRAFVRARIKHNHPRWEQLLLILEDNPDFWVKITKED